MQNLNKKMGKKGQGLVEYIVLICLVAVGLFAIVQQLSNTTLSKYTKADNQISQL
jgi:Flp pilus assembly pilin Flp